MKIYEAKHPEYITHSTNFSKYSTTYKGGQDFLDMYLEYYSKREDVTDFNNRKAISYSASFAKGLLLEIKNSVFQRLSEVSRKDCPDTFLRSCKGFDRGIDKHGSTITAFMGQLLDDILPLRRAGIYVDRELKDGDATKATTDKLKTYSYIYPYNQILNWKYVDGELVTLLLEDIVETFDNDFDLPTATVKEYRLLTLAENGIDVKIFDAKGAQISTEYLEIVQIPFIMVDLGIFMLEDIADYQIAITNLASADISYALKANFPFYTEQYQPGMDMMKHLAADKTSDTQGESKPDDVNKHVGTQQGRRYAKGLERPGFIHPSSEPMDISMRKQEQLKREMRELLNHRLSYMGQQASADSKDIDAQGMEAGLSQIGIVLEAAERAMAMMWGMYENKTQEPSIIYPKRYKLKSDEEIRKEAKDKREHLGTIPSPTYQKEVCKEITTLVMADKLSPDVMATIHKEINEAEVIITDPETIIDDHEAGLVSTEMASSLRGYPPEEWKKAQADHAERVKRIKEAQSNENARGVDDLDVGIVDAEDEKTVSRNRDEDDKLKDKTRGQGK